MESPVFPEFLVPLCNATLENAAMKLEVIPQVLLFFHIVGQILYQCFFFLPCMFGVAVHDTNILL